MLYDLALLFFFDSLLTLAFPKLCFCHTQLPQGPRQKTLSLGSRPWMFFTSALSALPVPLPLANSYSSFRS